MTDKHPDNDPFDLFRDGASTALQNMMRLPVEARETIAMQSLLVAGILDKAPQWSISFMVKNGHTIITFMKIDDASETRLIVTCCLVHAVEIAFMSWFGRSADNPPPQHDIDDTGDKVMELALTKAKLAGHKGKLH